VRLSEYDAVVFGGWFMAGGKKSCLIQKADTSSFPCRKKLIVFGVGGSPAESPEIPAAIRGNFTEEEWKSLKAFYCPGGFNYEKKSGFSKFMIKIFTTILANKKDAIESEKNMAQMIAQYIAITYPEIMDKLILAVTTPYANKVVKEAVTGWIEMVKKEDHAALMIDTAEKMYSDARSELCKIQCPAYIISGSHDKTVGNDAPE